MGLFDEVRCLVPLPDGWDPAGRCFQTKDTPAQDLERYVLRADGTLCHEATGAQVPHHGTLTLYTDNIVGWGPHGYATDDGQAAWRAEYIAGFAHGTLRTLEGGWHPRDVQGRPRLTRQAWRQGLHAKETP